MVTNREADRSPFVVKKDQRGNIASIRVSGVLHASEGLSGSLTQTTDGMPYLVGINDIVITTSSNGQIALADSINFVPGLLTVSGTDETIIGSLYIRTTNFSLGRAMLGSTGAGDIGRLKIKRFSTGDVMAIIGGNVGSATSQTTTGSVVLPADDWYDFYLYNSSISGSAVCTGFRLEV